MEDKNLQNPDFDAMSEEAEEEVTVVVITDEDGNEVEFMQEMVVPVGDKQFAILVGLDEDECDCDDEECGHHHHDHDDEEDENVIVARIDYDENGDAIYVAPTDEEFEEFQKVYAELEFEDEE